MVEGVSTLRRVERDVVLGSLRAVDLYVLKPHISRTRAIGCRKDLDHVGPSAVDENITDLHIVVAHGQPSVDGGPLDDLSVARGSQRSCRRLGCIPRAGGLGGWPITVHLGRL